MSKKEQDNIADTNKSLNALQSWLEDRLNAAKAQIDSIKFEYEEKLLALAKKEQQRQLKEVEELEQAQRPMIVDTTHFYGCGFTFINRPVDKHIAGGIVTDIYLSSGTRLLSFHAPDNTEPAKHIYLGSITYNEVENTIKWEPMARFSFPVIDPPPYVPLTAPQKKV